MSFFRRDRRTDAHSQRFRPGGDWIDITGALDIANNWIDSIAINSLSPFAVAVDAQNFSAVPERTSVGFGGLRAVRLAEAAEQVVRLQVVPRSKGHDTTARMFATQSVVVRNIYAAD